MRITRNDTPYYRNIFSSSCRVRGVPTSERRLGYETLRREVGDSFTWRRFCRIPLDGSVPHPTTLMKLTTRCGAAAVDGLNEALLVQATEAKVLRTTKLRADTTVVPSNVSYPTTPVCWPRQSDGSRPPASGSGPPVERLAPGCGTGLVRRASVRPRSVSGCVRAAPPVATRHWPWSGTRPGSWPDLAEATANTYRRFTMRCGPPCPRWSEQVRPKRSMHWRPSRLPWGRRCARRRYPREEKSRQQA